MINLSLHRISRLLSYLPSPTWHGVHIAGTNGKGSVAAYLSSLFHRLARPLDESDNIRVGRFTSPHLIDRWDCITINDRPVSESLFLTTEQEVQLLAGRVQAELSGDKPTEFEVLTATAFSIFSKERCHVALVECGLGGRLDATNALPGKNVAVSVVTKIGLDHQGLLGETVEQIARQKAGIAKKGVPMVVDGSNLQSVKDVIREEASKTQAGPITHSQPARQPSSLPEHQRHNLGAALAAWDVATRRMRDVIGATPERDRAMDFQLLLEDVRQSYPARLQHVDVTSLLPSYTQPILLDGAHNADSAEILSTYVDAHVRRQDGSVIWILAMSQGKDVASILGKLLKPADMVIATRFGPVDGMPWVRPNSPAELAEACNRRHRNGQSHEQEAEAGAEAAATVVAADVVDALEMAAVISMRIEHNQADPLPIVVAGSLYLASDLLRALRDGTAAVKARFVENHGVQP